MKWLRVGLTVGLIEAFVIGIVVYFEDSMYGKDWVRQLISWHDAPELRVGSLSGYTMFERLYKLFVWLNSRVSVFPSVLVSHFWTERFLLLVIWLSIGLVLGIGLSKLTGRMRMLLLVVLAMVVLPVGDIALRMGNRLVVLTDFRQKMPWSETYVWMWDRDEDVLAARKEFMYSWSQRNQSESAYVLVSCLGPYELKVNDTVTYHGPEYGVWPEVVMDRIEIADHIQLGTNSIVVTCEFSSEVMHEHDLYEQGAVLVGGVINDGWRQINLADERWWKVRDVSGLALGPRVSRDAGYTERVRLGEEYEWRDAQTRDVSDAEVRERRLPLLEYADVEITKEGDVYDLGRFMPGYLSLDIQSEQECEMELVWGEHFESGKLVRYMEQTDYLTVPVGTWHWDQFSRRGGRYVQITAEGCEATIVPSFRSVGMPFALMMPDYLEEQDKEIWRLVHNTMKNDIQNHLEDSPVRERAMYLGDARLVSQCLLSDMGNLDIVKEMMRKFALSQLEDGSLPALAPSGRFIFIPDYVLQFPVWVEMVAKKTGEVDEVNLSVAENTMHWAARHESKEGLMAAKQDEEWWIFIDWSDYDRSGRYVTGLQIWYAEALRSMANLYQQAGDVQQSQMYRDKAERLVATVRDLAFDEERGVLVDSFSPEQQREQASLVTNALAGRSGWFDDVEMAYFSDDWYLDSGFSQTWVIEWMIRAGKYDLALETIRGYWGGMIENGATGIYETYHPGQKPQGSASHAWGCGPVWLLPDVYGGRK